MYGNNFDYTDDQDLDRKVQDALDQARNNIPTVTTQGYPDSGSMAGRLESVGVGNVGDFLDEAYTPYVPTDTPSYSSFMEGTPGRIDDTLASINAGYEAGKPARTASFQSILNDVKKFTYGDADAFETTDPAAPAAPAAPAEPAAAEIEAIQERDPLTKREKIKKAYRDFYGRNPAPKEVQDWLGTGMSIKEIRKGLKTSFARDGEHLSGNQLDNLQIAGIGTFQKGANFGENDQQRAEDAGWTWKEIEQWKAKNGLT